MRDGTGRFPSVRSWPHRVEYEQRHHQDASSIHQRRYSGTSVYDRLTSLCSIGTLAQSQVISPSRNDRILVPVNTVTSLLTQ